MSGDGGHGKRRGHEEEHEEHENHERWLVSYADMMTLLMVLFIVMFAISQVDSKKFMALKTGLASGFGAPVAMMNGADALLGVGGAIAPDAPNIAGVAGNKAQNLNDPVARAAQNAGADGVNPEKVAELVNAMTKASVKLQVEKLKQAEAELQQALKAAGLEKTTSFRFDERGLVASIATDKVSFTSGSATLLPTGRRILDALGPTLVTLPNRISIDGHTDSNPISTAQFPSNWELGAARATGVLRYLVAVGHLPGTRVFASTFADTEPRVPGHSAAAMAADRRVEIVILAQLDDSSGRALAQLGNSTPTPSTTTAPAVTSGDSTPAGSSSPPAGPGHNLLGPDPSPISAVKAP